MGLGNLVKRNCKLFFKDKGMFFTSLITPMILLVLYATFLANVYRDSFVSSLPKGFSTDEGIIDAMVGGQLVASLLAVCCITVAFCSNMLSVQDKITGAQKDFGITPVKSSTLAFGYCIASFASTLLICGIAMFAGLIYLSNVGWYLTAMDVAKLMLDVLLLTMFGTVLSSIINIFLSSQGQISAVGTIVSSVYGFICGAYMPIYSFPEGLQKVLHFLPGTYGTSLLKNHILRGVYAEMADIGFPNEAITGIKDALDCNIYFFGDKVSEPTMYIFLGTTVAVLMVIYIIFSFVSNKKIGK